MRLVEQGGVYIRQKSTDFDATKLKMIIGAESEHWNPVRSEKFWDEDQKVFIKVCQS